MINSDQWFTPEDCLLSVEEFFKHEPWYDPTSSPDSVAYDRAGIVSVEDDDGGCLGDARWPSSHHRFMNPPYSNPKEFIDRFLLEMIEADEGVRGVILVNAATSSRWWQKMVRRADHVCFVSPRIRFLRGRMSSSFILAEEGCLGLADIPVEVMRKIEKENLLPAVFETPGGVDLVQPTNPRYESVFVGFGGSFSEFQDAFGGHGWCVSTGRHSR